MLLFSIRWSLNMWTVARCVCPENWAAHLVPWMNVANSLRQFLIRRKPHIALVPSAKVYSIE